MNSYLIDRPNEREALNQDISQFPVTAILGARQTGKSTLARQLKAGHYFDLENPADARSLETPQTALSPLTGLIVIDEIQRLPDVFSLIRYLVDTDSGKRFLILGSASRNLIHQSSQTLAGRIGFIQLSGFRLSDLNQEQKASHWLRGAFPSSVTAASDEASFLWRENFIKTFLERDIPALGINIAPATLNRFWLMISHYHGQLVNYSELGRSLGVTDKTIRHYLDILAGTYMVRLLQPWFINLKKRLVRSPKLFIADSGIFHALQTIHSRQELISHPKLGASFEGYVAEEARKIIGKEDIYFWRTHNGVELDLFWQDHGQNFGMEIKYQDAPGRTKSMVQAMDDLKLHKLWVVYPGEKSYFLDEKIEVIPVSDLERIAVLNLENEALEAVEYLKKRKK